ncbi:MAG TPA: hypothetical protein DCX53_01550 [Anaerolineae bacterium]|nr:hypothetical protein [Anaerolineae bacterium]
MAGILLLISLACQALSPNAGPSLVGSWIGEYDGSEVILTFQADGTMAGEVDGDLLTGTFSANTETSPNQLNLIFGGDNILTIFEFVDENTIRMENNVPDADRPTSYSDFIIFQRME